MGSTNNDVNRMKEFFTIYTQGFENWDQAKDTVESFYDKKVQYRLGGDAVLGFDELMGFHRQGFDGKASFELDRIEEREDGIFSSGWMRFPGAPEGKYVASISKFENGKFILIENVDQDSNKAVKEAREHLDNM